MVYITKNLQKKNDLSLKVASPEACQMPWNWPHQRSSVLLPPF